MREELIDSLKVLREKIGIITKQIMEIEEEIETMEQVLNESD